MTEAVNIQDYYLRYGPMVLRRCRILLKNEEKALDAMQEVFVRLIAKQDSLRHQYPSSLLFRIATNVCLNILRSGEYQARLYEEPLLMRIAYYEENENRLVVSDLLDRVFRREKSSTREIAVMHYVYGLSLQEVARETHLSLSGVRKRIRKLRQSLMDHLKGEVPT